MAAFRRRSCAVVAIAHVLAIAHAQTSPNDDYEAAGSDASDSGERIEHCIAPGTCVSNKDTIVVNSLSPSGGPLDGDTTVVVIGHGYRNFGSLMRCKFGNQLVPGWLHVEPEEVANPYNHTMMACRAPRSSTPMEQSVVVQTSLNGVEFSKQDVKYTYYRHPTLVSVSPQRGSAATPQPLTLTRSTATLSGGWNPMGEATQHVCRFSAVILPDGKRQVPYVGYANATSSDETELQCVSPQVSFVAPVRIDVSLNGQQYTPNGTLFRYEDNWHAPAVSAAMKPGGRHGFAAATVGSTAYFFGGEGPGLLTQCPMHALPTAASVHTLFSLRRVCLWLSAAVQARTACSTRPPRATPMTSGRCTSTR